MPAYYEFFAGGGMARAGLGAGWTCLFANDIDSKKAGELRSRLGQRTSARGVLSKLKAEDLPEQAGSSPGRLSLARILSLAGAGAGLKGARSGTFWPFWSLMQALQQEGRGPSLIVLENVCGALASHDGKDFAAIGAAMAKHYRFGAVVMDAVRFVPQSRPRLFIIAIRNDCPVPAERTAANPDSVWHPSHLVNAYDKLSASSQEAWIWWRLPAPMPRATVFSDLILKTSRRVSSGIRQPRHGGCCL